MIPFNPLDKLHLGESVGSAMLNQPVTPLRELKRFRGAGIYAIYYMGDFPAYQPIAKCNTGGEFTVPIYVGKAVPKGARKGGVGAMSDAALFSRLRQHLKSLVEAENLNEADFFVRRLVVDDIWIPLGESVLIAKMSPIWNALIDGFGNHDPGKGRHQGFVSRWDVVHPGRSWTTKCQPRPESAEQIIAEIQDYLRANPPNIG